MDGTGPIFEGSPIPVVDTPGGIVDVYPGPKIEVIPWGAPKNNGPGGGGTPGSMDGAGAPMCPPIPGATNRITGCSPPETDEGAERLGGPVTPGKPPPVPGTIFALLVVTEAKGGMPDAVSEVAVDRLV